jgi:hypothetical protein
MYQIYQKLPSKMLLLSYFIYYLEVKRDAREYGVTTTGRLLLPPTNLQRRIGKYHDVGGCRYLER